VAFILFDSPQCIDSVICHDHVIDGHEVQIRRVRESASVNEIKTSTILVSADVEVMKKVSVNNLKSYFSSFGKVIAARKPLNGTEAAHFSFVQFASAEIVDRVIGELNLG
jgi:cellobiose-specific phosphotransferase system component IIA